VHIFILPIIRRKYETPMYGIYILPIYLVITSTCLLWYLNVLRMYMKHRAVDFKIKKKISAEHIFNRYQFDSCAVKRD